MRINLTIVGWRRVGDPDEGLELRDEFRIALQRSLGSVEGGEKTIPAQEVAAKLGLSW